MGRGDSEVAELSQRSRRSFGVHHPLPVGRRRSTLAPPAVFLSSGNSSHQGRRRAALPPLPRPRAGQQQQEHHAMAAALSRPVAGPRGSLSGRICPVRPRRSSPRLASLTSPPPASSPSSGSSASMLYDASSTLCSLRTRPTPVSFSSMTHCSRRPPPHQCLLFLPTGGCGASQCGLRVPRMEARLCGDEVRTRKGSRRLVRTFHWHGCNLEARTLGKSRRNHSNETRRLPLMGIEPMDRFACQRP